MKTLYIFDDVQLSSNCGVGTYLKELTQLVTSWGDMQICMIMFRANVEDSGSIRYNGIRYILLSKKLSPNPFEEGAIVCDSLDEFISDDKNNYFLFNYAPCDNLIGEVKKHFPLSTCICIVHDFNWTSYFLGKVSSFLHAIKTVNKTPIQEQITEIYNREKKQFHYADKVICLSEDSKSILQKYYHLPDRKLHLIPHGIKLRKKQISTQARRKWRNLYRLKDNEKVILSVGRISKAKGTYAFLSAFKEILKTYPESRWVIAGDLRGATELLKRAGTIATKITFTGYLDRKELSHWYQMADVGIIPSYTEQFCYVGIEMMNHRLPIVASDGLGVRCMFQDDINACIAHIGNTQKGSEFERNLLNSTLKMLSASDTQRYASNSYQILKKRYAYNLMNENYRSFFDTLSE